MKVKLRWWNVSLFTSVSYLPFIHTHLELSISLKNKIDHLAATAENYDPDVIGIKWHEHLNSEEISLSPNYQQGRLLLLSAGRRLRSPPGQVSFRPQRRRTTHFLRVPNTSRLSTSCA